MIDSEYRGEVTSTSAQGGRKKQRAGRGVQKALSVWPCLMENKKFGRTW